MIFTGIEWGQFLIRIQRISSGFSIFANFFLIHLILFKSPKQVGAYKFLMLFFSIFEIFYGVVVALSCPFHHTQYATYLAIVSAKGRDLSHFTLNILNAMYWGCYGMSLAIFGMHFVYRYLVASGNKLSETFNSWKIFFWFLGPLSFGAIWCTTGLYFCAPTKETTNFVKRSVFKTFGLVENEFVYLGPQFFERVENGTLKINWKPTIGLTINVMTVNVSFFTIFYFGFKCYSFITKMVKKSFSPKSSALQKEIPVVLVHLPFPFALILALFDVKNDTINGAVVMMIALYPSIDPFPTIFIVKDYRRAVLSYLFRLYNRILCRKNVVDPLRKASLYTGANSNTINSITVSRDRRISSGTNNIP